jgi:hypothetical protein
MKDLSPLQVFLGTLYLLIMASLTITFFVIWLRNRKRVRAYRSYGLAVGIIFVASELVALVIQAGYSIRLPIAKIIVTDIIMFFKLYAFTIIGIYYCTLIGLRSFPLLMRKFALPIAAPAETTELEETKQFRREETSHANQVSPVDSCNQIERQMGVLLPDVNIKEMARSIAAFVGGSVLYSVVLFWITKPQVSSLFQTFFKGDTFDEMPFGASASLMLMGVAAIAFGEEIAFRLGAQNLLAKICGWQGRRYWLAIMLTALVWSIGHVGMMSPEWVKMAQIFPVGLALGWLFWRYGAESSIIAHALFNVILLIPSAYLISH